MTLILAQGDTYPKGNPAHAYDLRTPYLRFIFGIIGITDIEFIYVNSLNVEMKPVIWRAPRHKLP
jgi:FMN-dependent NADH-azoreductase